MHYFEYGPQYPQCRLVQAADGNFYGTAPDGGAATSAGGAGSGCVYRITPAGFITNIASFFGTNGANPLAGLTPGPAGLLYGTTQYGGANGDGAIFSVTTDGVLSVLYSFDGTHGATPQTTLTFGNDGNLYGTTHSGGANNFGTIFRITPGGSLSTLFSFGATNYWPGSALCLGADGNFYGTTQAGPADGPAGAYGYGTIYRCTPGGVFTQLVGLTNSTGSVGTIYANSSLLPAPGGVMYGTLYNGGTNGQGSIYSLTTNGIFSVLVAGTVATAGQFAAGLTLGSDGNFYGTGQAGGTGYGGVFEMPMTNDVQRYWTILPVAAFAGVANGSSPVGGLTLGTDEKFYGVTASGGDAGWGAFFSMAAAGPVNGLASFNSAGGISPHTALTLGPDGNFYGATYAGGPGDDGTVFRITTNNVFTRLATFGGTNGYEPLAPLVVGPDNLLYGSTFYDAANNSGTLFSISTNGVFKTRFVFSYSITGAWPQGGLAVGPDSQLYGTTSSGGTNGDGTIFRLSTNGLFTSLFSFGGTNGNAPKGTLLWCADGFAYGTTYAGGTNGNGTIFRINTNGLFNTVATFVVTNGYQPLSGLTLGADGALYGSTFNGPSGYSIIYRVTTNGVLSIANSEANFPGSVQRAGLTPGPDQQLYTVTINGGANNVGTLVNLNTNGTAGLLSTLSMALGGAPYAPPVFGPDGNLYGTTSANGPGGGGTIYRFEFDRLTNLQRSGGNAVITTTSTPGGTYALFATTNLVMGGWTNIATITATNATSQLTDATAGKYSQRFYRAAAQ
jgi:uncharacterized repeat protein (TIGR03803 family)